MINAKQAHFHQQTMNRRNFVKKTGAATIAGLAGHTAYGLPESTNSYEYDKYGGWTGRKFEATGFFHVVKDDRWWMVTPEGNAFLSFGINHLHVDWFRQAYQRASMQQLLGISDMDDKEELYPALRRWFLQTCEEFGFNTVGVHNNPLDELINNPEPGLPYMQPICPVDIPHYKEAMPDEAFKDIFSQEFAGECDLLARQIAEVKKDDPYLLAYSMTDCPLFTEEDCRERADTIGGKKRGARIGWPRRLRNLGADAAGKKVYVKTMNKIYRGDIAVFNETYNTDFSSFDALEAAKNWRLQTDLSNGNEIRDNVEFLKICVDRYYQVAKDAIRRYDPNHLFVGDKLHANTDSVDTVLPVTSKYTDMVMYQMYAQYDIQKIGLDRWSKVVDKPFLNGDAAYSMSMDDMPWPFGPIANSLEQRAAWTREFMEKAFARPEFVGWHYCGIIDTSTKNRNKTDRQHAGLVSQFGVPYALLQKAIKETSKELYKIASVG